MPTQEGGEFWLKFVIYPIEIIAIIVNRKGIGGRKLNHTHGAVFSIIYSLQKTKKKCFASNQYIADCLGLTQTWVSKCISDLVEEGFLIVIVKRGYKRTIKINTQYQTICEKEVKLYRDYMKKHKNIEEDFGLHKGDYVKTYKGVYEENAEFSP